jgi:hypothetical protein
VDPVPPRSLPSDLGPWFYVQCPPDIPAPKVEDGPPIVTRERVLVEHALVDLRAPVERADLMDGRRIYRLREYFLWLMPKDQHGSYVWAGVLKAPSPMGTPQPKKLYWSSTSPITSDDVVVRDWLKLE